MSSMTNNPRKTPRQQAIAILLSMWAMAFANSQGFIDKFGQAVSSALTSNILDFIRKNVTNSMGVTAYEYLISAATGGLKPATVSAFAAEIRALVTQYPFITDWAVKLPLRRFTGIDYNGPNTDKADIAIDLDLVGYPAWARPHVTATLIHASSTGYQQVWISQDTDPTLPDAQFWCVLDTQNPHRQLYR